MTGILKKIQRGSHNRTTYRVGLLQAKAYRVLKRHTMDALTDEGISTVEWALLGLLCDNKGGMRAAHLAKELGVEAPFVTSLLTHLNGMKLTASRGDARDSRVKIIHLTEQGTRFVEKTEKHLRAHMKKLLTGIGISDVLSYIVVLEKIIENSKEI